jgi:hypothetical protein
MARDRIFCNHYRAMSDHDTCEVGIAYDTFKGLKFEQRPCFMRNGVCPGGCDKAVFPTPEEIAAEDAEFMARFAKVAEARIAIVESLGGPWKRGTPGASGTIDCPACKGVKTLRFSRAGYNGHIHAACSTDDCVRWME